ncbi:hypothetical protein ENH_00038610, partial [Eimeria necatrix]
MGPPKGLAVEGGLVTWAFVFAALLGTSWGCNEVTYQALGAQMTFDYDERTKLQAIAVSVITVGSTSCGLLHGVLGSSLGPSVEATRFRFLLLGFIYALLFLFGTLLMLFVVKEETLEPQYPPQTLTLSQWLQAGVYSAQQMFLNVLAFGLYVAEFARVSRGRERGSEKGLGPFFLLMVAYSCMIMAGAVTPMLLPYFCKHVVQSRAAFDWAPLLFTASAVGGMPLWVFLGSSYLKVEKKWRFVLAG